MKNKRRLPENVTEEQISEFWNHLIHPVTGYKVVKGNSGMTSEDKKQAYHRSVKRNQFNNKE